MITVPFEEAKLRVPTVPMAWPADRASRISINYFGIGGSNDHVGEKYSLSQSALVNVKALCYSSNREIGDP